MRSADVAWRALIESIYRDSLRGPDTIPDVISRHRPTIEAAIRDEAADRVRRASLTIELSTGDYIALTDAVALVMGYEPGPG